MKEVKYDKMIEKILELIENNIEEGNTEEVLIEVIAELLSEKYGLSLAELFLRLDRKSEHIKSDSDVELIDIGGYYIVHNLHTEDPSAILIFESYASASDAYKELVKAYREYYEIPENDN